MPHDAPDFFNPTFFYAAEQFWSTAIMDRNGLEGADIVPAECVNAWQNTADNFVDRETDITW